MKSVFITTLMFAAVLLAMYFKVFEFLSSRAMYIFSILFLIIVFIIAFKVLGNPFNKKDDRDEQK